MIALVIILNKQEYLEDILQTFVKFGVRGATILDSQGMASAIVNNDIRDIPLFGSLKTLLTGAHPYNKTIFTVLKEDILNDVVLAIKDVLKDERKQGTGFMFTVPVGNIYLLDK